MTDRTQPSAEEVVREHSSMVEAARRGEWTPIQWRSGTYRPDQVLEEITVVLADTIRFAPQGQEVSVREKMLAQSAAHLRDHRRLAAKPNPLGDLASQFAFWVVKRADRGSYHESVQAAYRAATGAAAEAELADDLRTFVEGYLDGTIDQAEFSRRLAKPRAKRRSTQSRKRGRIDDPNGLTIAGTEAKLKQMQAGADDSVAAMWEAFKRFALLSVTAVAPEQLDPDEGDLLLFEIFTSDDSSEAQFVRQFRILDADGDYDRMEQLHCELALPPEVHTDAELVWSNSDHSAWIGEVESSAGFAAIRDARALGVNVYQERV